jgi:hypothetical protein
MQTRQKLLTIVPPGGFQPSDERLSRLASTALGISEAVPSFADNLYDFATQQGGVGVAMRAWRDHRFSSMGFDALSDREKRELFLSTEPMLLELLRRLLHSRKFNAHALGLLALPEGDPQVARYRCAGGAFMVGHVYAAHPYDADFYLPVATYHDYLLEEKRAEFVDLAASLGAKTLRLVESDRAETGGHIGADVAGVGGAKVGAAHDVSRGFSLTSAFDDTRLPPNLPSRLVWYPHHPLWQAMARARLDRAIREHTVEFTYNNNFGVDASLSATLDGVGLKLGGNFRDRAAIAQTYVVTFWPKRS